jgi:hypothetical protein
MDEEFRKIMDEKLDEIIDIQKTILTRDDLFLTGATICKKSYDALRGVGFDHNDAIRIVAGGGMNQKKE